MRLRPLLAGLLASMIVVVATALVSHTAATTRIRHDDAIVVAAESSSSTTATLPTSEQPVNGFFQDVDLAFTTAVFLDALWQQRQYFDALGYLDALSAAQQRAAAAASSVPATHTSYSSAALARGGWQPSDAWWGRVAVCEEGGWGTHTYASNGVGTFVGDLGISVGLWNSIAGPLGLPAGNVATPAQQIEVANIIFERYGASAWTSGSCTGAPF